MFCTSLRSVDDEHDYRVNACFARMQATYAAFALPHLHAHRHPASLQMLLSSWCYQLCIKVSVIIPALALALGRLLEIVHTSPIRGSEQDLPTQVLAFPSNI